MTSLSKYKGVVKADATSTATVLTDYSSTIIDFQLPFTKNAGSHFVINSAWRVSTEGGMQMDATVTCEVSVSATSAYQVFKAWAEAGGARTMEFYTPDTTTGSLKVTGEWICLGPDNSLDVAGGSGDAMVAKFKFQSDGAQTSSTV